MVDNKTVAETNTFLRALEAFIGTFYVFNIAYPATIVATMTFVQKALLNLQDKVKRNPSPLLLPD